MNDLFCFFDNTPCFTKSSLRLYFSGSEYALNERIKRALKNNRILPLKNGFYTTNIYWFKEPNKVKFKEFVASKLRYPSYLSLEYVLSKYELLTEVTYPITSITIKTNRVYQNFLGCYRYSHIKRELVFGFTGMSFYHNEYFVATKARSFFDLLYLKRNLGNFENEIIKGLRINWDNFSRKDLLEFEGYVEKSKSLKMARILSTLRKIHV